MGAMTALQNLNKTNREMDGIQSRINTGLKVAVAKDNGAIYNIAQQQRSELSAYDAVRNSLNRAKSIADVALAAGEQISDIFSQMREKAVAASDASASSAKQPAAKLVAKVSPRRRRRRAKRDGRGFESLMRRAPW